MSRFLEPEPWLKARIDPAALAQSEDVHGTRRQYEERNGPGSWNERLATGIGSRERMAKFDALPPEWRRYCHEHNLSATIKAMQDFGRRSVKRAEVLGGLNLSALDL